MRYYREEKILTPRQKENGYFEYTIDDMAILFQLIVARSYLKPLSIFPGSYLNQLPATAEDIIALDQEMIDRIEESIQKLRIWQMNLRGQKEYYESLRGTRDRLETTTDVCGLFYLRESAFAAHPKIVEILLSGTPGYQSIVISREAFLQDQKGFLHPEYAIGFTDENYRHTPAFKSCDLSVMDQVRLWSMALRFSVHLDSLTEIPREVFAPVYACLEEKSLSLIAPVTSIILNAGGKNLGFDVMFRFLVGPP